MLLSYFKLPDKKVINSDQQDFAYLGTKIHLHKMPEAEIFRNDYVIIQNHL